MASSQPPQSATTDRGLQRGESIKELQNQAKVSSLAREATVPSQPLTSTSNQPSKSSDYDYDSDSSSDSGVALAPIDFTKEDVEWVDVEEDDEDFAGGLGGGKGKGAAKARFVDFVGEGRSETLREWVDGARRDGVDVLGVIRRFDLDFIGCIKLVNYVRSEIQQGNKTSDLKESAVFEDDRYFKPVIEDDAVLLAIEEILELAGEDGTSSETQRDPASERIAELEEQLQKLQRQFSEYQSIVSTTLDKRWSDREPSRAVGGQAPLAISEAEKLNLNPTLRDDDTHYFDSYAYNDIHETMLKDTIRTDAYRDFIYDNKHLFKDRHVLDVGCGTGILSMFAAKAGAAHVYAVDNSDIIHKCREIIIANNLDDKITCIKGKIEEINLPVDKVDVIISEWMGYVLLYESMLDSVLVARDRFLKPSSSSSQLQPLITPSICTLHISPISSSDFLHNLSGFWSDIYGFDMRVMTRHLHDDVHVRSVPWEHHLATTATEFRRIDIYSVTVAELEFENAPFRITLEQDVEEGLHAFVIWFDTFFETAGVDRTASSSAPRVTADAVGGIWPGNDADKGNSFTTSTRFKNPSTHWYSGVCLVDQKRKHKLLSGSADNPSQEHGSSKRRFVQENGLPPALKKGDVVIGNVRYKKRESNKREVDVDVSWSVVRQNADGGEEEVVDKGRQVWCLR